MLDRARLASWSLSLFIHAALIVGSLFIVWTVLPSEETPEAPVVISFDDPAPAAAPLASAADAAPLPAPDLPALDAPEIPAPTAPPAQHNPPREQAAPPPPRYETTFITAGASGAREVVYVVDASGSAISSFPYIAARLRDSLTNLHPSQRFQILLIRSASAGYDFLTLPPATDAPVLVDALPENIDAALAWLDTIVPGGRSDLPGALTAAMSVRADAVFVLARLSSADEAMDDAALLAKLDALNPPHPRTAARRTTLHAMQMLDAAPSRFLQTLAETHSGDYDLLTLDDLRSAPSR